VFSRTYNHINVDLSILTNRVLHIMSSYISKAFNLHVHVHVFALATKHLHLHLPYIIYHDLNVNQHGRLVGITSFAAKLLLRFFTAISNSLQIQRQAIRTWKQSGNKWDTRKPGKYMRIYIKKAQNERLNTFFLSLFKKTFTLYLHAMYFMAL